MTLINLILQNFFSFILIISLIVFIHEFGHFYVARLCSVQVEEFSIGFGKELFGFVDKKGTRWKICILPLGGYVKMFGDRNAASVPDVEAIKNMSEEDRKKSLIAKNVWQRMAIVAAGPIANFLLTIFIFTVLFRFYGINKTLPIISEVVPQSAAFEAGLQSDDRILQIDGNEISDFEDVRKFIVLSQGEELNFTIERNAKVFDLKIAPKIQKRKDFFGEEIKIATLGVASDKVMHHSLNIAQSFVESVKETYSTSIAIFRSIGELIVGKRDVKELGGPIKIAKYSGKTVEMGLNVVLWFMAMISLNLGVMNLLPVPMLDGGHLFFYAFEALFGRPLPQKVQQFGFQLGLSLILSLMIFTTFNDIRQIIFGG